MSESSPELNLFVLLPLVGLLAPLVFYLPGRRRKMKHIIGVAVDVVQQKSFTFSVATTRATWTIAAKEAALSSTLLYHHTYFPLRIEFYTHTSNYSAFETAGSSAHTFFKAAIQNSKRDSNNSHVLMSILLSCYSTTTDASWEVYVVYREVASNQMPDGKKWPPPRWFGKKLFSSVPPRNFLMHTLIVQFFNNVVPKIGGQGTKAPFGPP